MILLLRLHCAAVLRHQIVFRLKRAMWIRFPEKAHHRKVFLVANYDDAYAYTFSRMLCLISHNLSPKFFL